VGYTRAVKTVLVAGASGALGREVVRLLGARGARVRAMTRDPARAAGLGVETVVADARDRRTLAPALAGVDTVFSSLGASPLPDPKLGWRGFRGVDWPLNRNLVEAAAAAGAERFIYVSAHHTPDMRALAYIDAHERVVDLLGRGGLAWSVVRPTGFFSAIGSFIDMARRGRLPVFGRPDARTNPIHDADLAEVCVDAALDPVAPREIPAGGPEVLTRARMIELVFEALGSPPRTRRLPLWAMRAGALAMKPIFPRIADCLAFFAHVTSHDLIAPAFGRRTLGAYFQERARAP
jgi:uncharacterized protein YbjT (DUF2867 family)